MTLPIAAGPAPLLTAGLGFGRPEPLLLLTRGLAGRPAIYRPASPAGWRSKGTRRGPDPYFTTGSRLAGPGS